jgi:hypothetical protein
MTRYSRQDLSSRGEHLLYLLGDEGLGDSSRQLFFNGMLLKDSQGRAAFCERDRFIIICELLRLPRLYQKVLELFEG